MFRCRCTAARGCKYGKGDYAMKIRLNEDPEIVRTVKEGLAARGGYCPCRLQHIPENICICKEFKEQLADPDYHGACHCGLYVKD